MLDELYNPSIQDLELDEHQGKDRPVVYLDQAVAHLQAAVQAAEKRGRSDGWDAAMDKVERERLQHLKKEASK